MDRSSASCFVYAKASGMLAKSFIGERAQNLFSVKSLRELWSLLFTEEVPSVPQMILAEEIEKKATQKLIEDFSKLLNYYSKPDSILVELLHWFDVENLKNAAALLATNHGGDFHFHSIKPFNILNYDAWPNLEKMTANSQFSWYNKVPAVDEQQDLSNKIDIQFIKLLFEASKKLPNSERKLVQKVIVERYSMKNILWALRLKVYYNMTAEEVKKYLVYFDENQDKDDLFAAEALKILDKNVSEYENWANWKYSSLLNDGSGVIGWTLDPQVVESNFAKKFAASVKCNFHKFPFTSMVLVTWFFIKLNELDCIRTATEAIRLNVDDEQIKQIVSSL